MICIRVGDAALVEAIRRKDPQWIEKAKKKTSAVLQVGRISDGDGIWSEIKEVFILLQESKCIYCEFPLPKVDSASADKVSVDYDIEHYRPKNRVTPWPTAETLARRPGVREYLPEVAAGAAAGYLRLAFDPFNYVVSCKVCNSSYKGDRFPISGKADARSKRRLTLDEREKPLLLFPFGEHGDDPETFLRFTGPTVRPRPDAGFERLRAQAVIDFFELDTREGLLEGRCWMIQLLWPRLEERDSPDPHKRARAETFLTTVQAGHRQLHTACGRAFIDLYEKDRARAEAWYDAAVQYLTSKDRAIFQSLG